MSTQALSAPISSLLLLLVQTQAARWKPATQEQLIGAHLYLDHSWVRLPLSCSWECYETEMVSNTPTEMPFRSNNSRWIIILKVDTINSKAVYCVAHYLLLLTVTMIKPHQRRLSDIQILNPQKLIHILPAIVSCDASLRGLGRNVTAR